MTQAKQEKRTSIQSLYGSKTIYHYLFLEVVEFVLFYVFLLELVKTRLKIEAEHSQVLMMLKALIYNLRGTTTKR